MSKFEVSLPSALSDFVQRQVDSGLYDSATDVIADAVRRLADTDDVKLAALKRAIAPGVAEAEAKIFYDGTMEDILAQARSAAQTPE